MPARKRYRLLLALYAAVMLLLLFGRSHPGTRGTYWEELSLRCNLIPFRTLARYLGQLDHPVYARYAVVNLVGNVALFLPLGALPPLAFPRLARLWRTALAALGVMLAVELAQMLTLLGSFDVDDLILNLLGALLGYGLYRFPKKCGFKFKS